MMQRNYTWPVLTVLTVIAVAGGFQLGETAIAQIDPLYFEGAAAPARDVSQRPQPDRFNAYAAASGWEQGYAARNADCGFNCPPSQTDRSLAELEAPALVPYSDPTIEPRWEEASRSAPDALLPGERSAEAGRVARYMHYSVSADQAEIRAALDDGAMGGPDGL